MGTEQYSNLVLYRRGAGLLLNPYSPISEELANNDGIYQAGISPFWSLFRWGLDAEQNKYPVVSNETGAFYPDASNDYLKKIKTNGTVYGFNRHPFIYFSLKNNSVIKYAQDRSTHNPIGYKINVRGMHDIWNLNGNITAPLRSGGKGNFLGDYNPSAPSAPSGTSYDTVTTSAVNSNPDWYNFFPISSSTTYQALTTSAPNPPTYPNGRTLYLREEVNITYSTSSGFTVNYPTNPPIGFDQVYVNNYNPSRSGFVKYGTLPFTESEYTLITDNSDISHRPVWYKEYGTVFTSSTIPYDKEVGAVYYDFPEIILRDANDETQPEYDISSNTLITARTQWTNTTNPDGVCYMEKLGAYTALRTPNNETPFVMRNQIMRFDLRSNLLDNCPDACWHSNKVIKIKLKYQNGTVSIYKNAGELVNIGYSQAEVKIQITWTDYEEETVDNIDILFNNNDGGVDYGVLWSKEIECPAGQAKRLVDVCVMEIRDKT